MDIGLSVGGFVDVLLLPHESEDWPAEGTVADSRSGGLTAANKSG
ncbi:hypothetical protein ACFWR9_38905 [Streptomyces sp. NPDC058534]